MNYIRQSLASGLTFVGVPIGSARDITLRALDVLASADVLAAEDTRSLRKLMEIHGVPLEGRRVLSLHDHSGAGAVARLVEAVREGKSVAYASEAGMPMVADPGFELGVAMAEAGLPVTCAPGPSAVLTALVIAGLATDAFFFAGFLPSSKAARIKALGQYARIPGTLAFYESPKRIAACLGDVAQVFGDDRQVRLCRELTKKFEEVRRGTVADVLATVLERPPKGEIVLLIERGRVEDLSDAAVEDMLRAALERLSLKDAVAEVTEQTGWKKRNIYQLGLKLSK